MYLTAQYLTERFPRGMYGVIFDCDGVLFDSRAANIRYYNMVLGYLGLAPMSAAQEEYVHMHTVRESLLHVVPRDMHGRIPWACGQVDYMSEIAPTMEPEPGLVAFLTLLRNKGVRIAMHTNRTSNVSRVLEMFGLEDFFHPVMTVSCVAAKPDPEGVHKVLASWACDRTAVTFVGDSLLDALASHRAQVSFWAFRNEALQAERHITGFCELYDNFVEYFDLVGL